MASCYVPREMRLAPCLDPDQRVGIVTAIPFGNSHVGAAPRLVVSFGVVSGVVVSVEAVVGSLICGGWIAVFEASDPQLMSVARQATATTPQRIPVRR